MKDGKVIDCEAGSWPDTNHTSCVEIWEDGKVQNFYSSSSFPAISLIIVLTLSMTVIVGYVSFFVVKRDNKCIRTSGLILTRFAHFLSFHFQGFTISHLSLEELFSANLVEYFYSSLLSMVSPASFLTFLSVLVLQ